MNPWIKSAVVVVGAVVFSTVAINASDFFQGIDGSLSGLAIESTGPCGEGAVLLELGNGTLCVDMYEASAAEDCDVISPQNEVDTQKNILQSSCEAVSAPDKKPWTFINLTQAQQMCARSGKRLLTNEEWYKTVLGMSDVSMCAVQTNGSAFNTGKANCTTPAGVHDMVGNVWEWIDGEVVDGVFEEKALPEEGYVALVDSSGIVLETSDRPQSDYGEDYTWTKDTGMMGVIRGGFYGSGSDAGIFTLNASIPLDFRAVGVGFRCVKDVL